MIFVSNLFTKVFEYTHLIVAFIFRELLLIFVCQQMTPRVSDWSNLELVVYFRAITRLIVRNEQQKLQEWVLGCQINASTLISCETKRTVSSIFYGFNLVLFFAWTLAYLQEYLMKDVHYFHKSSFFKVIRKPYF